MVARTNDPEAQEAFAWASREIEQSHNPNTDWKSLSLIRHEFAELSDQLASSSVVLGEITKKLKWETGSERVTCGKRLALQWKPIKEPNGVFSDDWLLVLLAR